MSSEDPVVAGPGNGRSSRRTGLGFPRFQERPLLRPTHPIRAAAFLLLNLALYVFANAFLHYLSTGQWVESRIGAYGDAFGRPLSWSLVRPLSVDSHPWMILVFGLLLAAVITVPLLVACLYHSRYCALFLPCVAILAQAPVLTLCLAIGCVLVAATSLRHKAPLLAILLGLLPCGVYLFFTARLLPIHPSPIQRLAFSLPLIVAAAGSVAAAGLVLLVARVTRYLPGVIWPVVAALLAAPVWIYFQHVGSDELDYAVLADQLSGAGSPFSDQPRDEWRQQVGPHVSAGNPNGREDPIDLLDIIRRDLAARRTQVVAQCSRFIRQHPGSSRQSAVWWMQGIALDTQVSIRRLYLLGAETVHFYDDYPPWDLQAAQRSAEHWRKMTELFPDDVRVGEAWWRLALLELRVDERVLSGKDENQALSHTLTRVNRAADMLAKADEVLASVQAPLPVSNGRKGLFHADSGVPSREYLQKLTRRIAEARWLMQTNNVLADADNARAFMAYVSLDDKDRQTTGAYWLTILRLAEEYEDTELADNFALAEAASRLDPTQRAVAFIALAEEEDSDAAIRANYELGLLALQGNSVPGMRPAEEYFRRVARDGPDNPWRRDAEEHYLRLMPPKDLP